jgi:hypothetical protein
MFVAQRKLPLPQLICENVIVAVLIGLGVRGNLAGCGRCPLITTTHGSHRGAKGDSA